MNTPILPQFAPDADFDALESYFSDDVHTLPCAVSWCDGHSDSEAHTWDDLTHRGVDPSFIELDDLALDARDAYLALTGKPGERPQEMYVSLHVERDGLSTSDVHNLAERLRQAADRIEAEALKLS